MNNVRPNLQKPRTVFVVYDGSTGEVLHSHHVVVLPKAKTPSDERLEADALSFARKHSKADADSMKVLRVQSDEFVNGVLYKVNVGTTRLERVLDEPTP
jgi:hypothetical protein